jgi:hypothetical protein
VFASLVGTLELVPAFDVGDQQDVCVGEASGLDVRQVPVVEVDLGDRSRTLGDDHVVVGGQSLVGRPRRLAGLLPVAVVVLLRWEVTDRLAVDNDLGFTAATGFQQHGIVVGRRRHTRRAGLDVL